LSSFSTASVRKRLDTAKAGATSEERGRLFEDLLKYIFESAPGALVVANQRNYFRTEQVDLAVSNGGAYPGLPDEFLVECKNYQEPVDSKSVGYFLFISLMRDAKLAVVVALNGLTGNKEESTYAHSLALSASAKGCRLVVLTEADILSLTSPDELAEILRERWLAAWANGGIGI